MTSISQRFESLRGKNQCALIPFITAGDPDLETTIEALKVLDASGADFIELGVPYSDPLADGPVIQAAATRALNRGVRLLDVLDKIQPLTKILRSPIILFTYYNPILNLGIEEFLDRAAASGIKGLVIPDLPLEESNHLIESADAVGIEVILLVTPTSSKERIKAIAHQSRGFIYLVSVTGVTGMRSQVQSRVKDVLQEIRQSTNKPVAIGFGISGPEQARQMKEWGADGVIVGSAFVQKLAESTPFNGLRNIKDFCSELKSSISLISSAK
ncbi:tryptophan synthase subunit alpha [Mastigocoleus testarum]|uniref:Tryptophan synthase alpha chain n=1 Tax=Mastigocoleus testarum BC008 TaxID=371196 RepID=A0A0V7ZDS7_9CYAN|nr:tryptophan synthase subunit alpha [Mastigocoleus testarum]KST62567.1 tryptophan synthase subunit alpha [Mastigocoleus testarum BC008]KST62605.1 tryptophan synthase subunit alpha [Mastigocoleus testarum BC008]